MSETSCWANFSARMHGIAAIRTDRQTQNMEVADRWLKAHGKKRLPKAANLCQLPTRGSSPSENAKISEREMWRNQRCFSKEQDRIRDGNMEWLRIRRRLLMADGTKKKWPSSLRTRYRNVAIACEFGKYYDSWKKTHNQKTGAALKPPPSKRDKCVTQAASYVGVREKPAGSNRGSPQPTGWQRRVYGSDGVPWCACFTTCMAWDAGVSGSGSAGVAVCVDLARRGQGIYRGLTTDPSKVRKGDHAVIGGPTKHIEMVRSDTDPTLTIGGNTSGSHAGSQFNGDGCYARDRSRGEIWAWLLVRF